MKKLLLCGILALAAGSMAFAQWPDWFSVSGDVKTGFRADFLGGIYSQENFKDNGVNDAYINEGRERAAFSLGHDDAGNRAQLDMKFELENIGFRFIPRWKMATNAAELPAAWGWFEFMNDMIRISAGNIDDSRWVAPAPNDEHYSNGLGIRIEAMPVEGLNVGWFIGKNSYGNGDDGDNPHYNSEGWLVDRTFYSVFANSSFGAKYESSMFTVAAGLDLRANGQGRASLDFGLGGMNNPISSTFIDEPYRVWGGGTVEKDDVATTAYIGLQVNPMEALLIQASGRIGNMDDIEKYGFLHLSEKFAYSLGTITPRLAMHQKFDLSKSYADKFVNNDGDASDQIPVYLEFVPGVDIALADNLSAYAEIPLKFWDKWFEIGVKPGVNYKFASNFEIGCYYQFLLTGNGYDNKEEADPAIRNSVQVNFAWTF